MKQYDAYLFDMDGTIVQSFEPWLQIVQDTLVKYDLSVDNKTIVRKVFGAAETGMIDLGVPAKDLSVIFQEWDKKASIAMSETVLYPGAVDFLNKLKNKNKQLALITATIRPTVELILAKHDLLHLFDVVIAGDEMEKPKPDPGSLLQATKNLNVSLENAVMLGDSEKDIQAANNAGIESVLFYPPSHEVFHELAELKTYNPTYTVHSWQQLSDQLR